MHTIGGIDLQPGAVGVFDNFIDAGRAEASAGVAIFFGALGNTDISISHMQMNRLIFVMFSRGVIHTGQTVARCESTFDVIAFRRRLFFEFFQCGIIRFYSPGPRRQASGYGFETGVDHAEPETILETRFNIANFF